MIESHCIKPIMPEHEDHLHAVFLASLRRNPHGFIQDENFRGSLMDRALKIQSDQGSFLGLFTVEGQLLGFGSLTAMPDLGHVEIGHLHLDGTFHGKGLGRFLAEALLLHACKLGFHTADLHVTVTQKAALGLYRSLGFKETFRQTYQVAGQEFDTQHMSLPLDQFKPSSQERK